YPPKEVCRQLVVEMLKRELAELTAREELLRKNYEEPGRAGAEVRKQVPRDRDGVQLAHLIEMHERRYLRAYGAFVRGRRASRKSGTLAGEAVPGLHGGEFELPTEDPAATAACAEAETSAAAARQTVAGILAPGRRWGIGAPLGPADVMRAGVMEELLPR